jgi:hypothetical protein
LRHNHPPLMRGRGGLDGADGHHCGVRLNPVARRRRLLDGQPLMRSFTRDH